jgi:large subunit ribosomal protein LP0
MVKGNKKEWKANFFAKATALFNTYDKVLVVNADNVRSRQMQQIRIALRGQGEILMGKNTMIRKVMRQVMESKPELESLMNQVILNVGLVFTKMDLKDCADLVMENKISAPARAGIVAPVSVSIPAGPTSMGPEKTSFFQALNINTKIVKGTIEIISDVKLITEGDKVGPSEVALLALLKITPFTYGLVVLKVFDNGAIFDPQVLSLTNASIMEKFMAGVRNVAAVSLAISYPTTCSVPHSIINGVKNLVAVALETEISFPVADKVKEMIANPGAFAAAAPAAAAAAPVAAAKAPEPESEEEEMEMSLFD